MEPDKVWGILFAGIQAICAIVQVVAAILMLKATVRLIEGNRELMLAEVEPTLSIEYTDTVLSSTEKANYKLINKSKFLVTDVEVSIESYFKPGGASVTVGQLLSRHEAHKLLPGESMQFSIWEPAKKAPSSLPKDATFSSLGMTVYCKHGLTGRHHTFTDYFDVTFTKEHDPVVRRKGSSRPDPRDRLILTPVSANTKQD